MTTVFFCFFLQQGFGSSLFKETTLFRASVEFYSSPTYITVKTHVGLMTRVMFNFVAPSNLNELHTIAKDH